MIAVVMPAFRVQHGGTDGGRRVYGESASSSCATHPRSPVAGCDWYAGGPTPRGARTRCPRAHAAPAFARPARRRRAATWLDRWGGVLPLLVAEFVVWLGFGGLLPGPAALLHRAGHRPRDPGPRHRRVAGRTAGQRADLRLDRGPDGAGPADGRRPHRDRHLRGPAARPDRAAGVRPAARRRPAWVPRSTTRRPAAS